MSLNRGWFLNFVAKRILMTSRGERRQWQPTPVLLHGKFYGQRNLVGCSPWGRWELDMAEQLHSHFSLSCIGEGNGNPLQCSCLENPRDRGASWAAVCGVSQSRIWLKRLSSRKEGEEPNSVSFFRTLDCFSPLNSINGSIDTAFHWTIICQTRIVSFKTQILMNAFYPHH